MAEDLEETKINHEPTEDIKIEKKSLKEIEEMIINNKIIEGETIAAIYKYLLYRNKH